MIVLNAILTVIVSLAIVHLLQESFLSPSKHNGDFRYHTIRWFTIEVALASLHTNIEIPTISIVVLNGALASGLTYLTKYF